MVVGADYDDLVERAGGRYRFVALIQRRMRELERGNPPLVEKGETLLETALEELRAGKIWLAIGEEADKIREKEAPLPEKASPDKTKTAKPG